MTPRVHVKTYGCQMNERDSDALEALLLARGWSLCVDECDADVIIVNTCSVRAKAEHKALGKLGLLTAAKKKRPGRVVGAVGCMVQRMGARLPQKVEGLDFAVGPGRLSEVPSIIERVMRDRRPVLDIGPRDPHSDFISGHAGNSVSAFVTVTEGCNRGCSYCIVPSVRGGESSRPARSILAEVENLAARGVREVTLLGQSVTGYGRSNEVWGDGPPSALDLTEPFPRLIEAVASVPGVERVRFTSGHPSGCTAELVRVMSEVPRICEHIHLPVQSGSVRILRMMGRGYTADEYRAVAARIRSGVPGIAITTDVIVGFPSESETDFETTRRFMEETAFDNAFVFKYSPRPGTVAAGWADNVPAGEKMRRNQVLLEDQDVRCLKINEGMVGQVVEVLVEGPSLRNASRWSGRTRTNKIVIIEPENGYGMPSGVARVKITRARPQTLYGTAVGSSAAVCCGERPHSAENVQ